MRDCERICRYLHVPAQSGSDRILQGHEPAGTRPASTWSSSTGPASFLPDVSLASDFIVGFPTETDDDFAANGRADEARCRFKNSFIFKYSPRPGTIAINRFVDDVPEDVKRRRNNELLAVQSAVCEANNRAMVGQTVSVLVEGQSKLAAKAAYPASNVELGWEKRRRATAAASMQLVGRTGGDQIVVFDGDTSQIGQLVDVEVTAARNLTLFARPVLATALS